VTINELVLEATEAKDRFWFVQSLEVVERTAQTITLHFIIRPTLFVQVYYSVRSGRFNFALIGASGRLYGRDREHGQWHLHPFGQSHLHEPTPEGMSPQPIHQFLTEVETILIENDLI
jgi:hypothetical protein